MCYVIDRVELRIDCTTKHITTKDREEKITLCSFNQVLLIANEGIANGYVVLQLVSALHGNRVQGDCKSHPIAHVSPSMWGWMAAGCGQQSYI